MAVGTGQGTAGVHPCLSTPACHVLCPNAARLLRPPHPPSAPPCCSVDHLPLLNKLFELLGLGVSAWFAYR